MNFELSQKIYMASTGGVEKCEIPIFVHLVHKVCSKVKISSEIVI